MAATPVAAGAAAPVELPVEETEPPVVEPVAAVDAEEAAEERPPAMLLRGELRD